MFDDLVGIIIENILLKTSVSVYGKIDVALKNKGDTFAGCYKNPQILREALKHLPDATRISVVSRVKKELHNFEDEAGIVRFIKIVSST